MHKLINGIKIELTAQEISKREAEEAQAVIDRQVEIDAETAAANLKASAKAKLIAGQPLTEEEADTIVL